MQSIFGSSSLACIDDEPRCFWLSSKGGLGWKQRLTAILGRRCEINQKYRQSLFKSVCFVAIIHWLSHQLIQFLLSIAVIITWSFSLFTSFHVKYWRPSAMLIFKGLDVVSKSYALRFSARINRMCSSTLSVCFNFTMFCPWFFFIYNFFQLHHFVTYMRMRWCFTTCLENSMSGNCYTSDIFQIAVAMNYAFRT